LRESVKIVTDLESAELLRDPMRRLILDMLASREMTEAELAAKLKLSDASVNHHLKGLKRTGLVQVVRTEAESHGILQKFYRSAAPSIILDYEKMPYNVRRYAFVLYLERLRGALSLLRLASKVPLKLTWDDLEALTDAFAEEVVSVSRRTKSLPADGGKEELIIRIYSQALLSVSKRKEGALLKKFMASAGVVRRQ